MTDIIMLLFWHCILKAIMLGIIGVYDIFGNIYNILKIRYKELQTTQYGRGGLVIIQWQLI